MARSNASLLSRPAPDTRCLPEFIYCSHRVAVLPIIARMNGQASAAPLRLTLATQGCALESSTDRGDARAHSAIFSS